MKWFTADTHFGSGLISKLRGYPSVKAHDESLLAAINDSVLREDELIILGDFGEKPAHYRMRIKCKTIRFIMGNHDKNQQSIQVFGQVFRQWSTKVCGHKTYLSHYPHAYWDKSHNGSFHLYGHTHGYKEEILDGFFPERRSMDVGMDNAFRLTGLHRPFNEEEIYNYLIAREGHEKPEMLAFKWK